MKSMIRYSMDFDFIYYSHVCANIKEEKQIALVEMKQRPSTKNKVVKECYDKFYNDAERYYKETLSFIQRNDLDMFFKRVSIFKDYLMELVFWNVSLESQAWEDMKSFVLKTFHLKEEEIKRDDLTKKIQIYYNEQKSYEDYNKEAELILEIFKDENMFSRIFKNAVSSLKEVFIREKYDPLKEEFSEKLEKHNIVYKKNPVEFMLNQSWGMLKESELKGWDYQPYISHYAPFKILLRNEGERGIIVYSDQFEKYAEGDVEGDLVQSLMKFLSDPKRYEMVRMLSKKKWYANELAKEFKITPATMSYHLNKLFALGLVSYEQGVQNKMYIELDKERLQYLLNRVTKDLLE